MTLPGRGWADRLAAASDPGPTHLATEAVVAYVDGELSVTAHERATRHLAECAMCTAEVAAQRQARAAVRSAAAPAMPPALLAALHAIPQSADLPPSPDGLAVDAEGRLVVPNTGRPSDGPLGFGESAPLGSSRRLGSSTPLGRSGWGSWRSKAGASVVLSGLVVGAIAFGAAGSPPSPGIPRPGVDPGPAPVTNVPARFDLRDRQARPDGDADDADADGSAEPGAVPTSNVLTTAARSGR